MTNSLNETHDPSRTSWVGSANVHAAFPVQNLPLGIFANEVSEEPRPGVAIGDYILDLRAVSEFLPSRVDVSLADDTLNKLLSLPPVELSSLRRRIFELLADSAWQTRIEPALFRADECRMQLPCAIGDYTDFYVGIHHANNVGRLFRPDNPLLPNYKWIPIGYHGRASSVRPSGVAVRRPSGQRKQPSADQPSFGPTERLDYELELGVWIGTGNRPGQPIDIRDARRHIAGLCLLNDWSARDFQAWEYQPLGPFLAKSFHTTVSPWIVTSEALEPFRIPQSARPDGDPSPLPYLYDVDDQGAGAFSIELETLLVTDRMRTSDLPPISLGRGSASNMYWTVAQMLTHHSSNGCDMRTGDLLGTGTISTADLSGAGSLLELTKGGVDPVELTSGESRAFLEDGDEVIMTATARAKGFVSIGFGECRAMIAP